MEDFGVSNCVELDEVMDIGKNELVLGGLVLGGGLRNSATGVRHNVMRL